MGRIYSIAFDSTAITNANGDVDWVEILPADDKPVKIRGFILSQSSEAGDAAEELLRFRILRLAATVTSGSGGASFTPSPVDSADAAAGCTVEVRNTTVATTSGSTVVCAEFAWNERASPFEFWFPDERFAPKAKQGEGLFIRQETTVADDVTCMGTIWIEEE
jgi:hypothetical protein